MLLAVFIYSIYNMIEAFIYLLQQSQCVAFPEPPGNPINDLSTFLTCEKLSNLNHARPQSFQTSHRGLRIRSFT